MSAASRWLVKFATIDSTVALLFAFFINAAILIVSAATFYGTDSHSTVDISVAYKLLSPVLDAPWASTIFALALLASGQNSTITGTMAGQIVMEGFLHLRLRPWVRRLLTRSVAIVPAVIVACALWRVAAIGQLLVLSQVVLSFQLSFAVVPLVMFTSDRRKMGNFANRSQPGDLGLDRDVADRIIELLLAQRDSLFWRLGNRRSCRRRIVDRCINIFSSPWKTRPRMKPSWRTFAGWRG